MKLIIILSTRSCFSTLIIHFILDKFIFYSCNYLFIIHLIVELFIIYVFYNHEIFNPIFLAC